MAEDIGIDTGKADGIANTLDLLNAEGEDNGELQGQDETPESEGETELRDPDEDGDRSGEEEGDDGKSEQDKKRRGKDGEELTEEELKAEETKKLENELKAIGPRGKIIADKLKAIDPLILKKVPELQAIIFRDNDMGKIFPTIHDAREAQERVNVFNQVEEHLNAGDSSLVLTSLAQSSPEALEKFATDFLPTLLSGSQELYAKATLPVIRNVITSALNEGLKTGNKYLENAAKLITAHLFGTYEFPKEIVEKTGLDPEREEFNKEKKDFYTKQTNSFVTSTLSEVTSNLWNDIVESVKPYSKTLAPFVKQSLTQAILADVQNELRGDRDHQNVMKQYWAEMRKVGLSPELKSKISNAYLRRAKSVINTVRDRRLQEALGKDYKQKFQRPGEKLVNRGINNSPRQQRSDYKPPIRTNQVVDSKRIDYNRTSNLDILNDKVTLK